MLQWNIFFTNGRISSIFVLERKKKNPWKRSVSPKTISQLSLSQHFSGLLPKQNPHYLHNLSAQSFATTKRSLKNWWFIFLMSNVKHDKFAFISLPVVFQQQPLRHAHIHCSSVHKNTGKVEIENKGLH